MFLSLPSSPSRVNKFKENKNKTENNNKNKKNKDALKTFKTSMEMTCILSKQGKSSSILDVEWEMC